MYTSIITIFRMMFKNSLSKVRWRVRGQLDTGPTSISMFSSLFPAGPYGAPCGGVK